MNIRAQRVREKDRTANRRYRATFRFSDGDHLLFEADIVGNAMSDRIEGRTADGASVWHTRRNRAILPTVWPLKDGENHKIGALRKKLFRRDEWRAESAGGDEAFSLRDPRGGFSRTFDLPAGAEKPEFDVTRNGQVIGALVRISSDNEGEQGRGPLKWLDRFLRARDWVMTIVDDADAPDPRLAALAIILAHEITLRYRGFE